MSSFCIPTSETRRTMDNAVVTDSIVRNEEDGPRARRESRVRERTDTPHTLHTKLSGQLS